MKVHLTNPHSVGINRYFGCGITVDLCIELVLLQMLTDFVVCGVCVALEFWQPRYI